MGNCYVSLVNDAILAYLHPRSAYLGTAVLYFTAGRRAFVALLVHARFKYTLGTGAVATVFNTRACRSNNTRSHEDLCSAGVPCPSIVHGAIIIRRGGGESSCSFAVTNALGPRADDRKWRVAEATTAGRIRAPPMAGGICVVDPHADATPQADAAGDQRGGPRFLARVSARWGLGGVFIIERDTGGCCRSNACTTRCGGGDGDRVAAGLAKSIAATHTCAMCAAFIINTRGCDYDLAFLLSVYTIACICDSSIYIHI